MHEMANDIISERTTSVIEEWDFEKRKNAYTNTCPCYSEGQKCHDVEELNCFFCYCPNYDRSVKEGRCKINSLKGKIIEGINGKIFNCSDCDFPHRKENAIKLLANLFK